MPDIFADGLVASTHEPLVQHIEPSCPRNTGWSQITALGHHRIAADRAAARCTAAQFCSGLPGASAATVGPLEELAASAGYLVQSSGKRPLLRYVLAIRPGDQAGL